MNNYPTLFFGSHDMPRMIDRLADGNLDRALALAALMLTAKGVPFVYYGEEIGMHNIIANNLEEMLDIQGKIHYELALVKGKNSTEALLEGNEHNRDKSRSPMQWNGNSFAGFSNEKVWIKINSDYPKNNLQELLNKENSILKNYKKLITLRNNEKVLQYGKYDRLEDKDAQILFSRYFEGDQITVVINFGREKKISFPKKTKILMGIVELITNDFIIYRN